MKVAPKKVKLASTETVRLVPVTVMSKVPLRSTTLPRNVRWPTAWIWANRLFGPVGMAIPASVTGALVVLSFNKNEAVRPKPRPLGRLKPAE